MENILFVYLQLLLLTLAVPVVFGVAVFAIQRLFCNLVGAGVGRPLLLGASALSTLLREVGHMCACVIFFHRITDIKLLDLRDPDGELGFVEHSYNPRNPIALLGNLFYALFPVILGLLAVLVILLACFRGVISPFFDEVALLGERGGGFADYARLAWDFLPRMFTERSSGVFSAVVGALLLLAIVLGIHVDVRELADSFSGLLVYAVLALVASGILVFSGERVTRIALGGLRSFATGVTALFLAVLLFAVVLVALGAAVFLIRTLFGLDAPRRDREY
ncbi:MAG: hypothetical protein IJA78_06230 [Clostridia bacterium]|nr:hypothetical protein [Clostridia bacterium]